MTKKGFNVCMITHAFYPEYSGAAIQCYTLSKKLIEKECKIMILTFTNNPELPHQERIDGIDVRRIYVKRKGLTGPITAIKLLLLITKERKYFDILHFHGFNNHLLWIVWLNIALRKKIILKMSLMNYDTPKAIMSKGFFHRFSYHKIDKIVATTTAMIEEFKAYPLLKAKGCQIPNGVDVDKFRQLDKEEKIKLRKKMGLPISKKIIVFSGVIGKRKGVDILLEAWQMLHQKSRNSCPSLLLAGPFEVDIRASNPENEQLRQKIFKMQKNHPESFISTGMTQNIEDYYMASDIFVLPSRNEGLPNSLLEAMSCGLNCVVMDFPGINDLINADNQTGIIFKEDDGTVLYEALLKALNNNKFAYPARQAVIEKFSINKITDTYLQCYQEMV